MRAIFEQESRKKVINYKVVMQEAKGSYTKKNRQLNNNGLQLYEYYA
jgi:hypothetical protein